jgi:hypothetical protein
MHQPDLALEESRLIAYSGILRCIYHREYLALITIRASNGGDATPRVYSQRLRVAYW